MTAPPFDPMLTWYGAGPDDPGFLDPRIATALDSALVDDDELMILRELRAQIVAHVEINRIKQNYYEAKQLIDHLDIAVPATLRDIGTACGWAGTVVDVLDERIDLLGYATPDDQLNGLDVIFDANDLGVESNLGHVDSLTTGIGFVSVGANEDDPEVPLITVESASHSTVLWDYAKRRAIAGLSQTHDPYGNIVMETLYLENANIVFARDPITRALSVVDRNQHDYGRCFMTRLPNRSRPFQLEGRSEITRAIRYYTDAAVRTLIGMEVNREFYTAPQRFVLNARPEDFGVTDDMSKEERFRKGLSVAMGMINIVPPTADDEHPASVQEFHPAPPTPYIEQVKAYSVLVSAETGMPVEYFGFTTDNPPSADSIRQREFRLVKRASRRIGSFGRAWKEVAMLALLARDGSVDPAFLRQLKAHYANPQTPTQAATADEIAKMVASEVLVPDSSVTYDRYGLSDQEQIRLQRDKQKAEAKALRQAVARAALAAANQGNPDQGGPNQGNQGGPNAGTNAQQKPPTTAQGSAQ